MTYVSKLCQIVPICLGAFSWRSSMCAGGGCQTHLGLPRDSHPETTISLPNFVYVVVMYIWPVIGGQRVYHLGVAGIFISEVGGRRHIFQLQYLSTPRGASTNFVIIINFQASRSHENIVWYRKPCVWEVTRSNIILGPGSHMEFPLRFHVKRGEDSGV